MNKRFVLEIEKFFFNKKPESIGVSVSSGMDSMVLIHLLMECLDIDHLEVIHCNFQLRGIESDQDEFFIRNFCIKKNIICHVKKFHPLDFSKKKKISLQMAARKLRYDWFHQLFRQQLYDYIALGHHLDDSIETFFINIMRGTGLKGLRGISKIQGKFIRPLLNFTKKDIFNYAKNNNVQWRLDHSNLYFKYLRNKIRLHLKIMRFFSYFSYKGIKKTIKNIYEENCLLEIGIKKIEKSITIEKKNHPFIWKIKCQEIKKLHPLSLYLFKLFSPYGFHDMNSIKNLIESSSGKQIISKKYRIIKNREYWILVSNQFFLEKKDRVFIVTNEEKMNQKIDTPMKIRFFIHSKKIRNNNKHKIIVDFDKIKYPLLLRTWRIGDFFIPYNMIGRKKISKYYKDSKFSLLEKEQTWLLINGNGNIIWIINNRLDDRFKITKNTKNFLEISVDD
ncbi:tRNA lysidine(34) synthetase TilS [Blattabacterium cuenoti]|uniref:tRNA lysidine(34) synthetase TilS n=1 Tax=Blattabacterium cuenoti TaxID=1653831 RepID=UPI00163D37EB|nr:tRNA lysidine(34) synthetase TilS [Blattabacterium cuenoti]